MDVETDYRGLNFRIHFTFDQKKWAIFSDSPFLEMMIAKKLQCSFSRSPITWS